jgi:hypothetical protein
LSSGYFSSPSEGLDPDLFDGDILKEDVRTGLLNLLYSDLEDGVGFKEPWDWAKAWLAGSGITYQWGNGDLDVLFGADFPMFLEDNPQFPRLSMREVADYTNQIMRASQWPKTRHVSIGGSKKKYEITFFWNPTTGMSIDSVHPYAAYSLTGSGWVVRPPDLPHDPHNLYPRHWYDLTDADYRNARTIQDLYGKGASGKVQGANAAKALWRDIHEGRKQAFSDTGAGYGDFHNFRWQRAKETGAVDILRHIVGDSRTSGDSRDNNGPSDIITRAAIRYAGPRYWQ